MVYITGDTHRDFYKFYNLDLNKDDIVIILGDAGINFYLDDSDEIIKQKLNSLGYKFFLVQGNHEERPENISSYKKQEMFGGKIFIENKYPNLIFAKNGEIYNIESKTYLVVGGAYSIDKFYRIMNDWPYFNDEQLTVKEQSEILEKCRGKKVDYILSHTCPLKYEPRETFTINISEELIDKSMEKFLDKIEENVEYSRWYCGHFHIEKQIDKIEFMFGRIKRIDTDEFIPKYEKETGYEIVRDTISNEIMSKEKITCPVCDSNNIIVLKGDGHKIIGLDLIGIKCNNCKKIYGFNNVKYKTNCPKEL